MLSVKKKKRLGLDRYGNTGDTAAHESCDSATATTNLCILEKKLVKISSFLNHFNSTADNQVKTMVSFPSFSTASRNGFLNCRACGCGWPPLPHLAMIWILSSIFLPFQRYSSQSTDIHNNFCETCETTIHRGGL